MTRSASREAAVIERVWYDDDATSRALRTALAPLSLVYGAGVALRGALFDAGVRRVHASRIPAISIGNLTVGGTGKTPVAAWLAGALRERGARPAIVLRGYGGDEPRVHALLNPGVPVVVNPDRVAGIARAASEGCDLAVLDDAFQHRRAARELDVVLLGADRWPRRVRLLPAGPFREPPAALGRATYVLVTRKAASAAQADALAALAERHVPAERVAIVALVPEALRTWGNESSAPTDILTGRRVLAVSAIGDPRAFRRQLESLGAIVEDAVFADHHAYTASEAASLARRGEAHDLVVCTLKDAVKLGPLWPRAAPAFRYLSQGVRVERGAGAVETLLESALASRRTDPQQHAGRAGPA